MSDAWLYPAILTAAIILWLVMKWWIRKNRNSL